MKRGARRELEGVRCERAVLRLLAALLLCLPTLVCPVARAQPAPGETAGEPAGNRQATTAPASAAGGEIDSVQGDLLAIQRAVDPTRPLPPGLWLPSFEDAVKRLLARKGPEAERAKELARVILVIGAAEPGRSDLMNGFKQLDGDLDAFRAAVTAEQQQSTSGEAALVPFGERVAFRLLSGDCYTPWPHDPATHDPATGVVKASFTGMVRRPLAAVRRIMDPQNWDVCNAEMFPKAYAVEPPAAAAATTSASVPAQDSSPPTLGSTWKQPIFEHFSFERPDGQPCEFRNLLCIDARWTQAGPGDPIFRTDYGLLRSLGHDVGTGLLPGGLDLDCGFIEASEEDDDETFIRGVKVLDFSEGSASDGSRAQWAALLLDNYWDFQMAKMLCDCPQASDPLPGPPATIAPQPVTNLAADLPPFCKSLGTTCP